MRRIVTAVLVLVAIIHLMPIVGVLGAERLQSLYGIALTDSDLIILMRHRAVLLGLLGAFLLVAAFVPSLQFSALVLGSASVISFLVLTLASDGSNANLARVVVADWIALALLSIGFVAYARLRPR